MAKKKRSTEEIQGEINAYKQLLSNTDYQAIRCTYNLNGECQLYSMPCKEAEMCELEVACLNCQHARKSKSEIPCRDCDEKENQWK